MEIIALAVVLQALERRLPLVVHGHDDLPHGGRRRFADDDEVAVVNAGADHGLAVDAQGEVFAAAEQTQRHLHEALAHLLRRRERSGCHTADDRQRHELRRRARTDVLRHDAAASVVFQRAAGRHLAQIARGRLPRKARAGLDLAHRRRAQMLIEKVVHKADDPLHGLRIFGSHKRPPLVYR